MNSGETNTPPGQNKPAAPRGQTRPPAPDTPELAERRAQAPAAQALIKATRRLFAEGGPEWATDKRIHDTATRPGGRKGFPLGTIRYYFGGREQLLVHVARHEHLTQLDRVRRALRKVNSSDELTDRAAQPRRGSRSLPGQLRPTDRGATDARAAGRAGSAMEDWIAKLSEMVGELKARGVAPAGQDPCALALLWSSITAGLAAHHLANPQIDLQPALDLAQLYATSLQ